MTYSIIGVAVAIGLVFYFTSCRDKSRAAAHNETGQPDTTAPAVHKTEENAYEGLREMAFATTPEKLQLSLPADKTVVFGVIMDWGIEGATATVLAYQTGDASLYLSTGGAVIGGGGHKSVSNEAKKFVSLAQTYLSKVSRTETTLIPVKDEVNFYLLTNKGIYVGREIMENFEDYSSGWLPLFDEGNKVLAAIRMTVKL